MASEDVNDAYVSLPCPSIGYARRKLWNDLNIVSFHLCYPAIDIILTLNGNPGLPHQTDFNDLLYFRYFGIFLDKPCLFNVH